VVDVVLQEEIVRADPVDDAERLFGGVQEEAGDVPGVDRFDQQADARRLQLFCREGEIFDEDIFQHVAGVAGRRDAGQAVHLLAAERMRIADRLGDALAELVDSVWQHGDAALACRPVARRQIEQSLRQAVLLEARGNDVGRMIVRRDVFDGLEAGARGGVEAIEKVMLAKEHRQIG
jgi:hypothetical protein